MVGGGGGVGFVVRVRRVRVWVRLGVVEGLGGVVVGCRYGCGGGGCCCCCEGEVVGVVGGLMVVIVDAGGGGGGGEEG